ncbi:MAG: hypothetical protein Q4B63_07240 [Clostridium perfringens]|nr:hypothetical protein [Clostridium perfringens]
MKNIKKVLKSALIERMINLMEVEENNINKKIYKSFIHKITN